MLRKYFVGDKVLWGIIIFLYLVSVLVAYSATVTKSGNFYLVNALNQTIFVFAGLFITWLISWVVSPSWLIRTARVWVVVAFAVSCLVFVPGIAAEHNEAYRWIHVPFSERTICPFDFLRVFVMIDLVAQLSKRADVISKTTIFPDFWRLDAKSWQVTKKILIKETLPIFWPSIVSIGIIFVGNFSTALILGLMVILILMFGNVPSREIVKISVTASLFCVLLILGMYSLGMVRGVTVVNRVIGMFSISEPTEQVLQQNSTAEKVTTIDMYGFYSSDSKSQEYENLPDAVYQKEMSKAAMASGGLFGKGPGNSTFRAKLPHAANDCVFAFIVEEYGFVGGLVIIFAYVMVLVRGSAIANRSRYYSFYVLSMAIVLHIFITALVNMMVSAGLFVTGQTLPLISKGGSSIIANSIALGILLGISACAPKQRMQATPEVATETEYGTEVTEEEIQ